MRRSFGLVAVGLTFVVCGVVTAMLSDEPTFGYGAVTGGAIAVVVGLVLARRQRRDARPRE